LRARLDTLALLATEDAATIMYGSIGREEVTESSDVDWTILIDGPSDPSHLQLVAKTADRLKDLGFKAPGSTDTSADGGRSPGFGMPLVGKPSVASLLRVGRRERPSRERQITGDYGACLHHRLALRRGWDD
jgi:hypothetical protein